MKKSMIFVGMLAIGYANAQEGKVGINTDQPKATLDIQPNADNAKVDATTNQGIIIPKLSKARVKAIATSNLVEGTKVYVTDDVTAADTQFIGTGKGFYFYNGIKWVKQLASDTDTHSELWAQRDNAGIIETYLKPADTNNDIVSYQGNRKIYNNLGEFGFDTNTFNLGTNLSASKDLPLLNVISSDVLPNQARLGAGNPYTFDNAYLFSANASQIKQSHLQNAQNTNNAGTLKSYSGSASLLFTDRNVTGDFDYLSAFNANVKVNSNVTTRFMYGLGSNPSAGDFEGNTSPKIGVLEGLRVFPSSLTNSTVTSLVGITANPVAYKSKNDHIIGVNSIVQSGSKFWYDRENGGVYPTTTIKNLLGTKTEVSALSNSTITTLAASHNISRYYGNSNVTHGYGVNSYSHFGQGATVKDFSSFESSLAADGTVNMDNYAVFKFFKPSSINLNGFNPKNMYGLWLADINNGSENNFAIHTGIGKVRIGDLAQTGAGDRVVYTDENGVLKAGVSASANVKLATSTNVACEESTSGTMNFGSVTINGKATEAFGFCMKNSVGEYKWFYIYGGASVTTGSGGTFGNGL